MRSTLAIGAAAVALSGCALKGDVRRVERQLLEFREETARVDSARAVELAREIGRVVASLDAMQDSLAAQHRRYVVMQAETRTDLTEVLRQLVQVQELTGQNQQRLTELRGQLEQRATMPVAPTGPVATGPGDSAGAQAAPGLPPPDQLYDLSLSQLRRGSPQAARMGFQQFLQAYPNHERAADAMFFVGESWAASEPDSAAVSYEEVARSFPDSPRAPSALYKLGLLAEQRGDVAGARVYYQRVLAGYSRSEEAALARAKLNPGQ